MDSYWGIYIEHHIKTYLLPKTPIKQHVIEKNINKIKLKFERKKRKLNDGGGALTPSRKKLSPLLPIYPKFIDYF